MTRTTNRRNAIAFAGALVAFAGARQAAAANPDCSTLPTPVYVTGSSAVKPLLEELGKTLAGASTPVTIVYQGQGSCTGVNAILSSTLMTGTATYWDTSGAAQTCNLDLVGQGASLGVSDVFPTSCPGVSALPTDVGDFFGPVQVMEMVVPVASSQVSISAEAAYLVWGLGQAGQVDPWTDETLLFRRNDQSGTQTMISKAINVPAAKWKGVDSNGSSGVLTKVTSSPIPEKTIGILGADFTDANRSTVKVLAFQPFGQSCAHYPDSSPTSFDKKNARDDTYPIWGPIHLVAKIDTATKKPADAQTAHLVGMLTGDVPAPTGIDLIKVEQAAHTIPLCAMSVIRSTELGPVAPYTPPNGACGCYFESLGGTPSASCTTCTKDSDCTGSATHCRYGYCEAN